MCDGPFLDVCVLSDGDHTIVEDEELRGLER